MRVLPSQGVMPWVVIFAALMSQACGRNDTSGAPGAAGGPCYGNGTCDSGLVCGSGQLCIEPDPCARIDCSDHGTCVVRDGVLGCACDAGYMANGTSCLECLDLACEVSCPAEMAAFQVGMIRACIDRYEASVFAQADCTGTRYGEALDDLPPGFPDAVESVGCAGLCAATDTLPATVDVYACSVRDILPSAYITWFQAKRACENAGKQLCTYFLRVPACQGPDARLYPYGPTYDAGACNSISRNLGTALPTASLPACEGGLAGLFDMSGNVAEWTWSLGGDSAALAGSDYRDIGGYPEAL